MAGHAVQAVEQTLHVNGNTGGELRPIGVALPYIVGKMGGEPRQVSPRGGQSGVLGLFDL